MSDIWLYLSMPFICAAVGYGTNWLCIKMMSYPTEFIGYKPLLLGWQGVIPRRAPVIAGIQVDLMTSRLIAVNEIFDQIDAERLAIELEPILPAIIEEIIDDLMLEQAPKAWEAIPYRIKKRIYKRARQNTPELIEEMMEKVKNNIDEIFDIKGMMISAFTDNPEMLVKLIQEIGYKELTFVQNSGAIFGFLFGLGQMVLWMFYGEAWILPVAGILVGSATNWLALNMIFSPKHPIKIGPFTLHGLFMKRQAEVATDMGLLIAAEILNPQNIIQNLLQGPSSDKLLHLVQKNVKQGMDEALGYAKPFVTLAIGSKRYLAIKNQTVNRIMSHLPEALTLAHSYTEEAMDIDNTMRLRMQDLTPEEFEGLLRPAFKEDEWQLIALGAVLGFLAGWAQLAFMFGGNLLG